MSSANRGSSFGSCFSPAADGSRREPPPPPPPMSFKPYLATYLYHTDVALFSLTWSRSLFGRALDLHLHYSADDDYAATVSPLSFPTPSSSISSFHLHIEPFLFWRKNGSRKLRSQPHANKATTETTTAPVVRVFWDLSRAKFGSGPEPESGFYIAVVVDGEMTLLLGDSARRAYGRTKAQNPSRSRAGRSLILRREHVIGNGVYATRARFGGKSREICVNCGASDEARLTMSMDGKKVLQVKRLKWKFRGNERIVVDGVPVQVSWDVYNWLFDDATDSHAVFMFRFENESGTSVAEATTTPHLSPPCRFGMNGVEARKMRKCIQRSSGRSSSISPTSSACSSSVMEWASTEETDRLSSPTGFSLVVYAWKK